MKTEEVSQVVRGGEARRAASVWVAGVGAVLLFVSAALFVAVQWKNLPDFAKLGIILAVTASFMFGGRRLKRTLPSTGGVLFHLGAFLLPVDLAAINLRVGLPWEQLLLAEGLLGIAAFTLLNRLEESRALRIAASISVVATALGIGATTAVPAAVALGLAGAAMFLYRPGTRTALVFAAIAGYLPVLALPLTRIHALPQVIVDAGLPRSADPIGAIVAGVLSVVVLLAIGYAESRLDLVALGFGAAVTAGSTAFISASLPRTATMLAPFAAFVVVELLAYATRNDTFWGRPVRWLAIGAEIAVSWTTIAALGPIFGQVLRHPLVDPLAASRFAILGAGWTIAAYIAFERNRDGLSARVTSIAAAILAVACVASMTASPWPTIALLIVAGAALLERAHPLTDAVALSFLSWAVVVGASRTSVAMALAAGAALVLVRTARTSGRRRRFTFVVKATTLLTIGAFAESGHIGDFGAVLAFVGGAWLIAIAVDLCDGRSSLVPRIAAVLALSVTGGWTPAERIALAALLVAQFAFDGVRLRAPILLYGAIIPINVAVFDAASLAGAQVPYAGVVLCIAAIVWTGLYSIAREQWRDPFLAAAVVGTATGLVLSMADPVAYGLAAIVCGAIVIGIGVLARTNVMSAFGGLLAITGIFSELFAAHVTTAEAYVAPVVIYLLIVGLVVRRANDVSSWEAYAPTIALAGGVGLLERIVGGAGWHTVVAGCVGVLAISVGGYRRMAGPLFTGTAVLASVVIFESLAVVATVPTWGWFALGGAALLSIGIALERSETSPMVAGRRVVDTIATNFS